MSGVITREEFENRHRELTDRIDTAQKTLNCVNATTSALKVTLDDIDKHIAILNDDYTITEKRVTSIEKRLKFWEDTATQLKRLAYGIIALIGAVGGLYYIALLFGLI